MSCFESRVLTIAFRRTAHIDFARTTDCYVHIGIRRRPNH